MKPFATRARNLQGTDMLYSSINTMKKKTALILASIGFLAFATVASADTSMTGSVQASSPQAVGSTLEVHIANNGSVIVRGAKVTSVSGSSIMATTQFGSTAISWTANVSGTTSYLRRYGGASSLSEIQAGDYVSFSGMLDMTASQLTVNVTSVKDWSVQKMNDSFSGTVSAVNAGAGSFTLVTSSRGTVNVIVASSTTITKGGTAIPFSTINVGDKISKATGLYDLVSKNVNATSVVVYVDQGLLDKRTFEGKLQSIAGTTAPTTLSLEVGSTTAYTVNVPAGISILGKTWLVLPLSSFKVGDTVRVYGAVELNNNSTIDATIVRDASTM